MNANPNAKMTTGPKAIIALILTLLLAVLPGPCPALMSLDFVTKERAKELGIVVTATPAGPDAVSVEIAFEQKGGLARFYRADLNIYKGDKLFLSASLRETRTAAGRVSVSLAADRASLAEMTVRLVEGDPGNFVGHDVKLSDFVDLTKLK